ncbi:EpsI family protein [bacterium]|nr:EpsI family protein [bacterium]
MTEPSTPPPAAAAATKPVASPVAQPATRGPSLKQLIIVVAILGAGVLLTAVTSDVKKVSEPGIVLVNDEPWLEPRIGSWQGGPQEGLLEAEKKILPADTAGARRLYRDAQSNEVYASIVLAGRDVTSIHRPEMCLPGQGWKIEREFVESIPISSAPDGELGVMRMNTALERDGGDGRTIRARAVFAYWFVGKDKTTPHHWQRIMWTSLDRVFHNTNHRWAYIMVNAPVTEGLLPPGQGRSAEETMVILRRFIQDLHPSLMPGASADAPLIQFTPVP